MKRSAVISECGKYRYTLEREFEDSDDDSAWLLVGTVLFVLNNPSTADGETEDPTSRRGIGYTFSWGYRRLFFANTNPWRSTEPKLARMPPEPILAANDQWVRHLAMQSDIVIAAWGDKANRMLAARAVSVLKDIKPVYALAYTKAGVPRHPLYLKADLKPQLWQ